MLFWDHDSGLGWFNFLVAILERLHLKVKLQLLLLIFIESELLLLLCDFEVFCALALLPS